MAENAVLRELRTEDYPALEEIICASWNFEKYCTGETVRQLAHYYLVGCLAEQTYTRVAVVSGKAVGVIMGNCFRVNRVSLRLRLHLLRLRMKLTVSSGGFSTAAFFSQVDQIDAKLLKRAGREYDGELSLLAVDSACRGMGIGKILYADLMKYFSAEHVSSFYLYTDTDCSYGFYEHQVLKKRCELQQCFSLGSGRMDMTFFLYDNTKD